MIGYLLELDFEVLDDTLLIPSNSDEIPSQGDIRALEKGLASSHPSMVNRAERCEPESWLSRLSKCAEARHIGQG
jgi:hypothetical protein